jgi:hypothetical protein
MRPGDIHVIRSNPDALLDMLDGPPLRQRPERASSASLDTLRRMIAGGEQASLRSTLTKRNFAAIAAILAKRRPHAAITAEGGWRRKGN